MKPVFLFRTRVSARLLGLLASPVLAGVLVALLLAVCHSAGHGAPAAIAVGLVPDPAGINDGGFNWQAYQGLLQAGTDFGVTGTVYTPTDEADYAARLEECVTAGNDLCFAVGFGARDATLNAAQAYSLTDFMILDTTYDAYPDNLRGVTFASGQAGYLAGTLAGLMTISDVVGDIGGMQIPAVTAFVDGYRNGAQCANPDLRVLVNYTGTFIDPELGAAAAQEMITAGADVIFAAAGPTGNGAVLTATQSGAWGIGVDVDIYHTVFAGGAVAGSDKLLTSAVKRLDMAAYWTIADVVSGTFTSGTYVMDLARDGVGLAPFHEADPFVDAGVRLALEDVRQGLISGTIDLAETCRHDLFLPAMLKQE